MELNLYNILQQVLKEEVSPDKVEDAIANKYQVIITYSDEKNNAPQQRLIEPYAYGLTKASNPCLRAYQYNGDTKRGVPKWKLFRLDRITSWLPTERHFTAEPRKKGWRAEDYNEQGDDTMSMVISQVKFDNDNPNNLYSPNDTLYRIRREREDAKNSSPININNTNNGDNGPVDNDGIRDATSGQTMIDKDMFARNMEITRKEKEGYNIKRDKAFTQRGPILPDNATEADKEQRRREMKRARDRKYDATTRKDLRWQRAADSRPLIPKKYRSIDIEDEE